MRENIEVKGYYQLSSYQSVGLHLVIWRVDNIIILVDTSWKSLDEI